MIDLRNEASAKVVVKLGFTFWKQAGVNGYRDNLSRRTVP